MLLAPGPPAPTAGRTGPPRLGLDRPGVPLAERWSPGLIGWAFLALPLLSLVGGAGFLWPLLAPLCVLGLLDVRDGRLPGGAVVLAAFLAWAGLTSLPLLAEGLGATLLGGYRWLVLASVLGLFLHVANRLDRQSAVRTVTVMMVSVWGSVVGFGLLSFVAPTFELATPVQALVPRSLLANEYLFDLTRFRLSEVQVVLGEVSARPAAPFAYANGWGSAFVLATPMTAVWLVEGRRGWGRALGIAVLAVGCVVAVASLNRGVWLLLVAMGLYLAARARQRLRVLLVALPLAVTVTAGVLAFTPVGDRVEQRLAVAGESDRTRTSIVAETVAAVTDAPVVGYGGPIEWQGAVPIGTHGLSWYLMVSHGLVGFALFTGWLMAAIVSGVRATGAAGRAAHLTLVLTALQLPIYGLLPQLPLVGAAAAVCLHLRSPAVGPRVAASRSPR